jgi:LysM repeat protein
MAAVIAPDRSTHPAPRRTGAHPSRPALRVVAGGRSAAHRRQVGVYRRRRVGLALAALLVAGIVLLAIIGAAALVSGRTAAGAAGSSPAPAAAPVIDPGQATVYVVQPGDTLWSIARRIQPEGDVRPLVDALADRNGGAGVQAGQRLLLDDLAG